LALQLPIATALKRHLWGLQQNNFKQIYRVRGAILITGNLDREIFTRALQNVVNWEEILRTSFHCLPGMTLPLQAIASTGEVPISEHNLSDLSPEEQEALGGVTSRVNASKLT